MGIPQLGSGSQAMRPGRCLDWPKFCPSYLSLLTACLLLVSSVLCVRFHLSGLHPVSLDNCQLCFSMMLFCVGLCLVLYFEIMGQTISSSHAPRSHTIMLQNLYKKNAVLGGLHLGSLKLRLEPVIWDQWVASRPTVSGREVGSPSHYHTLGTEFPAPHPL